MPTGYGYVRDKEPLFVNWAEVSQKFTDQLKADEEERIATKNKILNDRADFNKTLQNRPVGQNTALNNLLSSMTQQMTQYSLDNLNMFKNKNKTLQEYNAFENTLRSGTDLLFNAAENFNKNFDNFAQRSQSGEASQIETFMHELVQNYTDFGRVSVDVDPKSGELIISELTKDGKPSGKTLDVSQLGYFSTFQRDRYDIDGQVKNVVDNLEKKFMQDSKGRTLEYKGMLYDELVSNEELMKGFDTEIEALIDEGFELESVLADSMNYKIVTEKTDNINELFFNQDTNEFEITEEQKQAAFDHVKDKMIRMIGVDRREPTPRQPKTLDPQRSFEQYLVFEDKPVEETASERKARLKRERDQKVVKDSNTWYETEFLTNVQSGDKYNIDELRNLLINTPFVVDDTGKISIGNAEVYNFDKKRGIDFEDISDFKKKLKAVLDPNQEVFLYYTANPDAMTDEGGIDYTNY